MQMISDDPKRGPLLQGVSFPVFVDELELVLLLSPLFLLPFQQQVASIIAFKRHQKVAPLVLYDGS